ncbi:MAG TPA: hypothetical protein PKY81_08955, partial [bacterium]|nr:hypothetical protein [bacterium]
MIFNKKVFLLVIVSFFILLIFSETSAADVSSNWTNVSKTLKGDFLSPGGSWSDTDILNTDTQGYKYIELYLTPGTNFQYKFRALGGDEEISNRTLSVLSNDTVIIHNWADTPLTPINLRAYSDNNQVVLTW